jgi:sulfite reductase (NADPH) hemoprotein beta-component
MYQYQEVDQEIVNARVVEYRDQVERFLDGELSDDEFLQLRLRNGLYKQRHAYMLRVAIPYGLLSSEQLRKLGQIADKYDKGYGHFTTRQNIQYNWPKLEETPALLEELASVQMHAIQTSGNCIRNVTVDHFAGVAPEEIADPRPYAEMIRQWSTLHPEFNFLPRKFKIALSGSQSDAAATLLHDIGIRMRHNQQGQVGFQIFVGGGIGRTPVLAQEIRPFLEKEDLLSYLEAILRIYNLHGNRKNKYKARIKILVRTLGIDTFRKDVETEWQKIRNGDLRLSASQLERYEEAFPLLPYREGLSDLISNHDEAFLRWVNENTRAHKIPGYSVVTLSLKSKERPPGDMTASQMQLVADLADQFSFSEIRTTHEQNLILAHVEKRNLYSLWTALREAGLATANVGKLTDMICCPGIEYCNLANASSISLAKSVTEKFEGTERLYQLGEVKLKMSGCVNACAHHHVGHIGVLGVSRDGEEYYQLLLGGSAGDDASLGRWVGRALSKDETVQAIDDIVDVYLEEKQNEETFLATYRRIGNQKFFDRVYGQKEHV